MYNEVVVSFIQFVQVKWRQINIDVYEFTGKKKVFFLQLGICLESAWSNKKNGTHDIK
jgi:hypothetical protein